jgi:UDP:flavonoid glycosyltransferase YjiC (YdhE family)
MPRLSPTSRETAPYLNVCCEPAEFLTEEERRSFEPVAFFGCIPTPADLEEQPAVLGRFGREQDRLRIYACCGTVAFRYYSDTIVRLFEALAEAVAGMPDACALISLGGATIAEETLGRLRRPNVETVDYADQWAALGKADVFLTHHGLNSTHEAIFRRVPMLSYPIFSDQPAMAKRCRSSASRYR